MANNEIFLYGSVGMSWWNEDYFTSGDVREQLANMSGPITVHINSGGGIATEGQAIYTALVDYADQVNVVIDGVAASAASLIAMAGDTITMRLGSYMLIHDPAQPWTEGRGTEEDHLRLAKQLNVTSGAYADVYAARAGITRDEARAVMKDETFIDGPEAVKLGFASAYDGQTQAVEAARFDYRIYAKAPQSLREASKPLGRVPAREAVMAMMAGQPRTNPKETENMADKTPKAGAVVVAAVSDDTLAGGQGVDTVIADPVADAATATIVARATMDERNRVRGIQSAVTMAGLPATMAATLIAEGVTVATAVEKISSEWKKGGDVDIQMAGRGIAKVGLEAREKQNTGIGLALMAKSGLKGGERNEFSSMTLAEMARASIEMVDGRRTFGDKREMIGYAFTMAGSHTTSDFGNILANIMGKSALQGWEEAEETYQLWTRKGTLTDFKPTKRVGAGLFGALPVVAEGADYTYGTVGDRGEQIALATYGKLLRITRQAIINDDLSILGQLPRKYGRAARATIGNLVYAILTSNPALSDGVALFHANHANLAGAGAALSVASLSAARAAMRIQKESAAGQALNITPKYLLVPAALETAALQLISSTVDPTVNKGHAVNPVNNMAQVVTDARLDASSAVSWYMAADGNAFDTIEVAYLDGVEAPYLEEQTAWTSDGVEMKVRIDAGVAPLDFRTLYKNPGA